MFAEKACNLIKELSRCEEVLPAYNVSFKAIYGLVLEYLILD